MPWWLWVLIWSILVLTLLAMLVWFAFTLFKKLMTTAEALEKLASQVADLDLNLPEPAPGRFTPAIFLRRHELGLAVDRQRANRAHHRQIRLNRLISQAKLLQQAPLTQRTDPHA